LTLLVVAGVALLGVQGLVYGVTRGAGAAQAARVGREFKLRAGRTVTLARENLRLRLVRVAEDSRCPTGVACVWAGNAEVLVEVGTKNRRVSKTLRLNTNASPERPAEDKYRGYTVRLVRLDPHPRAGRKIRQGEYTAALLVVKD
jgi:cytochrome c biogenesis factor